MRMTSIIFSLLCVVLNSNAKAEFRGAVGISALETVFGLTAYRAEIGLPLNLSLYGEYDTGDADLIIVEIDYEHTFQGMRFYVLPWKDHEGPYLAAGEADLTGTVDDDDVSGTGDALEIGYTRRWGIFYASSGLRRTRSNGVDFFTYPTSIGINIGF